MLEPIGFWSYTRLDDDYSGNSLSVLRKRLLSELQQRVGRRQPARLRVANPFAHRSVPAYTNGRPAVPL